MLPDFSSHSDEELVASYVKLLGQLRSRGIIHSKNVLGDIGERLAIAHYNKTPGLPKLCTGYLFVSQKGGKIG